MAPTPVYILYSFFTTSVAAMSGRGSGIAGDSDCCFWASGLILKLDNTNVIIKVMIEESFTTSWDKISYGGFIDMKK